jgi:hypothetical protein
MMKKQRLNIYIDPTVIRRLKLQAVYLNMPMNKLAEEILDKHLPKPIIPSDHTIAILGGKAK